MMKAFLLLLATLPQKVLAVNWNPAWDVYRTKVAGTGTGFGANFLNVLADGWYTFVRGFVMAVSVVAIVWGAQTMQGVATDEGNRENGKKIIIGALIGLVLAILSGPIVDFVKGFVNPTNFPVCGSGGGVGCP